MSASPEHEPRPNRAPMLVRAALYPSLTVALVLALRTLSVDVRATPPPQRVFR